MLPVTVSAVSVAVALVGLASAPADTVGEQTTDRATAPPNIVVIEVDDQSMHTFTPEVMPNTFRLLVDGGTEFTTGIATPPLCCPSRAGFLTGQYPHNHGVFVNNSGYTDLIDPDDVLPVWLQGQGYTTGVVGKFLNGVRRIHGYDPAPGWDHWEAVVRKVYRNGQINLNGTVGGAVPNVPQALNEAAVDFIDASAEGPFFLWFTQLAPHTRKNEPDPTGNCIGEHAKPLARDFLKVGDIPFPRPPSFNERDVSDKPAAVQALRRLPPARREAIKLSFRCAAASLQVVDRGVKDVWRALKQAGLKNDTVVIYTSDNGFLYGEHRIRGGKGLLYEESVRVPLAMHVPSAALGEPAEREVQEPVANIDLTPTILELAGASPCTGPGDCRLIDGSSAVGLLGGAAPEEDRAVLFEQGKGACKYAGLRTPAVSFAVNLISDGEGGCTEGDSELYLLDQDPFELENRAGETEHAQLESELKARLGDLRGCAGTEGIEGCE